MNSFDLGATSIDGTMPFSMDEEETDSGLWEDYRNGGLKEP